VNGTELVSVEFPRIEFRQQVQFQIGCCDVKCFVGGVGPTLIMKSTDITQLTETYKEANSGSRVRSAIVRWIPWSAYGQMIQNVTSAGTSAGFIGSAVTFCSTIRDIVELTGCLKFLC
jgi:hypothetical protein